MQLTLSISKILYFFTFSVSVGASKASVRNLKTFLPNSRVNVTQNSIKVERFPEIFDFLFFLRSYEAAGIFKAFSSNYVAGRFFWGAGEGVPLSGKTKRAKNNGFLFFLFFFDPQPLSPLARKSLWPSSLEIGILSTHICTLFYSGPCPKLSY